MLKSKKKINLKLQIPYEVITILSDEDEQNLHSTSKYSVEIKKRLKKINLQIQSPHNPEKIKTSTDNLWHLWPGLTPHNQLRLTKIIYQGQLDLIEHKVMVNLFTYDQDLEFVDSCPKVCSVESDYEFPKSILEYAAYYKNQLIQLRSQERQREVRLQFAGQVEGKSPFDQVIINELALKLIQRNKGIRINFGLIYADLTLFHINQIFGEHSQVPYQTEYSKEQETLPTTMVFVISLKPHFQIQFPHLLCKTRTEFL